jgi:hypothetical protein
MHYKQTMNPAAKITIPMFGTIQCTFASALHPYQNMQSESAEPMNIGGTGILDTQRYCFFALVAGGFYRLREQ